MGLHKGHTNNPAGRKKGSLNKVTAKIREKFSQLLEDNLDTIKNDLKKLEPKDRIKILLELAKYVIPTLQATTITPDDVLKSNFENKIKDLINKK